MARFVAGLRASGVRVSIAESEDAWRAVEHIGVTDRRLFYLTLRSTLVKEAEDFPIFDELFPLYFGTDVPPLLNPQAELNEEEQEMLRNALQQLADELSELLSWLLSGQGPTEEELQDLAEQAGMQNADAPYQAQWYARRMQRLLGWEQLEKVLEMLWEMLAQMGMDPETLARLQQQVAQNQEALGEQLVQFAGQQIQDNRAEQWRHRRETAHDLMQRSFSSLNEHELDVLRDQVRRLAARLRSRAALRQKRGKRGKLDTKATIRANLKYGGVPLELRLRRKRRKPKLVMFLDVSTSMRPVAEFFLRLLYQLQDQVQKSRSFAYIDHLEDVTADLKTQTMEGAVQTVLTKLPPGYYSTDFGNSLRQFTSEHLSTVDQRTTVIVLGDARNNYRDPALDAFAEISKRARRVIWMTPEYSAQWGTGDSDMLEYVPLCTEVFQVRNLNQLANAIDNMLAS
ncbi:MAG TPA: VWA domain-containing protein [Aggregatilineales bacterium]|nr:VWA domain-containing protein [Aggregatilineales bacterium]